MSTDPRDMLGPTVTVTPAGQTTPTAGEDVYQAAAAVRALHVARGPYCGDCDPDDGNNPDCPHQPRTCRTCWRNEDIREAWPCPTIRALAVVDVAVRLTEQRVRDEIAEQLRVTSVAANLPAHVDPVEYLERRLNFAWSETDRLGNWALGLAGDLDAAHADAAQLRAAAGPAQDWASTADLQAAYTDLLRRLDLNGRLHRAERERAALAQRARVVDITQLNEAGTRSLCNTCGHEQFTPARPLYATESAVQASVVPPDPNGPEGGSGGAA